MNKFQIGDKVRVIKYPFENGPAFIGDEGIVKSFQGDYPIVAYVNGAQRGFYPDELEKIAN